MFKVTFSLLSNYNQSACCTLDRVLNGQSDFDLVLYKHHREFPLHKQVIPMLKCPIVPLSGQLLYYVSPFCTGKLGYSEQVLAQVGHAVRCFTLCNCLSIAFTGKLVWTGTKTQIIRTVQFKFPF